MLKSSRLTEGMPYCRERTAVIMSSLTSPELDEVETQPTTMFALIVESLSQVLWANKIFAYENFA